MNPNHFSKATENRCQVVLGRINPPKTSKTRHQSVSAEQLLGIWTKGSSPCAPHLDSAKMEIMRNSSDSVKSQRDVQLPRRSHQTDATCTCANHKVCIGPSCPRHLPIPPTILNQEESLSAPLKAPSDLQARNMECSTTPDYSRRLLHPPRPPRPPRPPLLPLRPPQLPFPLRR